MSEPKIDVLIDADRLQARIAELAEQIRTDYAGKPLVLIGVLKGSFLFLADLCKHLDNNVIIDFLQTSSYHGGRSTTGVVQIRKDVDVNIEGVDVLLVEDIVDTGTTLSHLLDLLGTRKPASLKIASLLSKPEARRVEVPVEYLGFEIENVFVVGYGLDDAEKYRQLPYIGVVTGD